MQGVRFLCLALLVAPLLAAQDSLRLRVDVSIVPIDAFVDDPTGKPITTLQREDFEILEDGTPREILNFTSAQTPYNILLLFDRSASTQDQWPFLLRAVGRLIEQLGPGDRIALAAFDEKPEMLMDWRSPVESTRQSLSIRTESSGTNLYQALRWAAQQMRRLNGRKGVVVFTDGVDNRLAKDLVTFDREGNPRIAAPAGDDAFQQALRDVMQAVSPFYFVAVNTDKNDGVPASTTFELQLRVQARLRMELVADRSNGHIYYPRRVEDTLPLYEQIGKELGNSYSLGFAPGTPVSDGKYHRVEVRVRTPGMRVTQSREGYTAP